MPRWVKVFVVAGHIVVLLLILLATGVFGPGHTPGRHLGLQNDPAPAVGTPADPAAANREIAVSASDAMTFEPQAIRVSAGETVTFVVMNTGRLVHEFTLGDAAMQQEHRDAMEHMPAGMAHDTSNSITIQPGATERLTWRFGEAGRLEFACHTPGHQEAGMRGDITIA